jgi:hypothetical protein
MKWSFLIVQMTEQQPKPPQIIDIVEMQPTQNGSQTPDTAQIEDILQMAAQMVDIQPLKRPLGGNIYLELTLTPSFVGTVASFQNRKSTLLDPFHSVNSKYMFPPRGRLSG